MSFNGNGYTILLGQIYTIDRMGMVGVLGYLGLGIVSRNVFSLARYGGCSQYVRIMRIAINLIKEREKKRQYRNNF